MDDLIDADFGKHDYDWLLTPPETPLTSSPGGENDHQITPTVPRGRSTRSASTARTPKASASQLHNGHLTKPARSSSVIRPSILNTHSSISMNKSVSILNTSTASIISRSSAPVRHSTTSRPSLTSRPVPARFQSPAKVMPTPTSPGVKTTRSHNTRSQILSNSNPNPTVTSVSPRLLSRSSTPTRKPINPLPTPIAAKSGSPAPRARTPVYPVDTLDFPNDVPPNLRTKLPERAVSVGRVRPGAALKTHSNLNSQNVVSPRLKLQQPLPVGSHSKFPENSPNALSKSYGHQAAPSQTQRSVVADCGARRTNKAGGVTESTGFGRNISKTSLDMALRHMDIKQSIGGVRGTSLIPHSIRSNSRPKRISGPAVPVKTDKVVGTVDGRAPASDFSPRKNPLISRVSNTDDPHGSSRYDAMLLKEDSCNLNWLHNIEDKSGQPPEFDHGFEPLPEPFGPL